MKELKKAAKHNYVYRRNSSANHYTFLDKLEAMQKHGKKEVLWTLSQEQLEQIEESGYVVEPYIYKVRTRRFSKCALAHGAGLLKDLHYASKKGKDFLFCKLRKEDFEFLKNNDISYRPLKYRILIN